MADIPILKNGQINSNTYVSFGVLITLVGGFVAVLNTIYSTKYELTTNQTTLVNKVDNLTGRVDKFERLQETWGFQDMFKWAVHLQRENEGKIKVPDPDTTTNR